MHPTYACRQCAKRFQSSYPKRFCSTVCVNLFGEEKPFSQWPEPLMVAAGTDPDQLKECHCERCGKAFFTPRRKQFCSRRCRLWWSRTVVTKPRRVEERVEPPREPFRRQPVNTHVPGSIALTMLGIGAIVRGGQPHGAFSQGTGNDVRHGETARRL